MSQASMSALKSAGINSEQDLKKLGISSAEIAKAKAEYFGAKKSGSTEDVTGEVNGENKAAEIKVITVPKVKLTSSKVNEKGGIYGHSIFRNGSVNIIKNSDRIKAPDNYTLVSGDKINITIWGYSEFSGEFIIGESGNITPKLVGRINLKGKTFSTARKIIQSRFGRVYDLKNSQIAIELSYSKVISINVIGEVMKPGSYSVPSLNSAFNILALAGGPTKLGSVRSIEIRRAGKLFQELDIYTFMFSPRSFKDQFLEDGDFLVVKTMKGKVEIKGEVKRPGNYEFKDGDTYSDILNFSGGFSAMANSSSINITRVYNNQLKMLSIGDVLNGKEDFKLINGDKIEVLKISNLVRNSVSIKGAVNIPGFYPFVKGEKISDLLLKARGITYEAFTSLGHVYRLKSDLTYEVKSFELGKILSNPAGPDNMLIQEFDQLIIFNKGSFLNNQSLSSFGMVNTPGTFEFKTGMTIEDVIMLSNGLKLEADLTKIDIERINYKGNDTGSVEIMTISYPDNKNKVLSPFDKIHFRRLPGYLFQQTITIKGEVRFPGNYSLVKNNDKIFDVIKRAGGFTKWAYIESSSINRTEDDLGLLLVNLEEVMKDQDSKFNYVLKPGDVINIPKTTDIVTIKGAIGFKFMSNGSEVINSPYHEGKRASFYIRRYGGGYDKNAKKSKVYVIAHNGLVKRTKFFGLLKPRVGKGDKVVVNYKLEKKEKLEGDKIDWDNTIENVTLKLTGLATFWILLERINL